MADINIERKGSSIWPWIVGLVLLAVVVFVVLQYLHGNNDPSTVTSSDSVPVQQSPGAMAPAPAPAPLSTDSVTADSAHRDSIRGMRTSGQ